MSRYVPYSPMHEPRKEVSHERMLEILAKHAQPDDRPTEPVGPNVAATPGLVWQPPRKDTPNLWVIFSQCERYSIHATRGGVGLPWRYECLRRTPNWNNVLEPGRPVNSKEEAVRICEEHAKAHP